MKILITSDLHIYHHRNDPRRLEDGLECLQWIYNIAIAENARCVIIAGDLFHNRFVIQNYAYAKACRIIKNSLIETKILLGNHDMVHESEWEINSLVALNGGLCSIIDTPQTLDIGGIAIDFLPYTPLPSQHLSKFETPSTVLITHLAIADAVLNAKYDVKSIEDDSKDKEIISVDAFKRWKKVYMGHYHYAQKLGNVEYIGSPMQLSFGEAGQKKHVIILDTETQKATYIDNSISPKFHIIEKIADLKNIDPVNAYVQMRTGTDVTTKFDIRTKLEADGVRELEFAPIKQDLTNQTSQALFNVSQVINDRAKLIEHFVDSTEVPEGLDKILLKKIGKDIVTGS